MIKLFRKIRYNIMEQSKSGRYFKYALGEIVLVVLGILIALSINNWNEERKTENELEAHLTYLIENLKSDTLNFNNSKLGIQFRYHGIAQIIHLAGLPKPGTAEGYGEIPPMREHIGSWEKPFPDKYDREFVQLIYARTARDINIRVNRVAIEEMKNSGLFTYIKNNNIKEAIVNYYSVADWRFGEKESYKVMETMNRWMVSLAEIGVTPNDISSFENPMEILQGNPVRLATLLALRHHASFRFRSIISLENRATDLIILLEKHIMEND